MTLEQAVHREYLVDSGVFPAFGDLIKDDNPIHRNREAALASGIFKDRPAFGVLLEAYAEQCANDALQESQFKGSKLVSAYFGFKEPAYHGDELSYQIIEFSPKGDGVELDVQGKHKDGRTSLDSKLLFGNNYLAASAPKGEPIFRRDYSISAEEKELFYKMLGRNSYEEIPSTLVAAAIPSTLLQMSTVSNGRPQGAYGGIDLTFFNSPGLGTYNSEIYLVGNPKKTDKGFLYRFEGFVSQNGMPITKGKILVYSEEQLNLDKLRQAA